MDINEFNKEYYDKIIKKAKALKYKKMNDYNSGGINRFDYALHGNQTFIDELYKKVLRLVSLIDSKNACENEPIEDTLIDVINYAADFYSYIEWKK